MGDEIKIKNLMKQIEDIYNIISKAKLNQEDEDLINNKHTAVKEIYEDFIENYLDFKEISDNLYDGIYISDGKGKTIFVNKAYTRTTGISKEEVIGRTVKEISDEGKLYKGAVTMDVLKRKETVNSMGKSFRNGKDLLVTGSPILDENGNIKLVVINNRDISGLKELEYKIAELQNDKLKASEEIKYLRKQQMSNNRLYYYSENMKTISELIETIAATDVSVLITGESGTGKEVVADEIYYKSKRRNKPFIKVNCAAIPAELLESELFGYEGGAFTDAKKSGKIGMFELANDGTILLDEIGDMPVNLQTKLLRVLQNKEIIRLGSNKSVKLNIRVIAATNKNLQELIKNGKFRDDLYYRLNVVPINIKPLRERKEDINYLAIEFLNKYNKKYDKNVLFEENVINLLKKYKWPGNIRELENLIERMVVINNDGIIKYNNLASVLEIEVDKLSEMEVDSQSLKETVQNYERHIILNYLKKYKSVNKAAKNLGLSQPALWKKCKVLKIDDKEMNSRL